eukprot:Gb_18214 [translate_table: standard]
MYTHDVFTWKVVQFSYGGMFLIDLGRTDLARFINAKLTRKWWQSLESLRNEPLQFGKDKSMDDDTMQLQREGLQLIAQGQVAVVLLMDEENSWERVGTNKLIGDQSISALQNLFQFQAEQLLRIQNLANSVCFRQIYFGNRSLYSCLE